MTDYKELAKQLADDRMDYLMRRPMNVDEVTQRCVKASEMLLELTDRYYETLFLCLKLIQKNSTANTSVQPNIFDDEETIPNCTVQILRNSITGEVSVGWFRNTPNEEDDLK